MLPDARVLTFGYDTHIRHSLVARPSQNRLIDHAADLLAALEAHRKFDPFRPLVFIAHSLGGLLVKDVLRLSRNYTDKQPTLAAVYQSTASVLFFGTPHAGADPLNPALRILTGLLQVVGFKPNNAIMQVLTPSAERLVIMRDEFQHMSDEKDWPIFTFQEEFIPWGASKKIVEDFSSHVNDVRHERIVHIAADHMGMCRFWGRHDPEFKKVESVLMDLKRLLCIRKEMTATISTSDEVDGHVSQPSSTVLTAEEREALVSKLTFEKLDFRYLTVQRKQKGTSEWFTEHRLYESWLDASNNIEHHGLLYIWGKPGAGKSVLMRHLVQHAKDTMEDSLVAHFFFNARGESLERSTEGLYRSLILQLMPSIPKLRLSPNLLKSLLDPSTDSAEPLRARPLEILKVVLQEVLLQLDERKVVIFVDALDECPEDDVRDMISLFDDICETAVDAGSYIRICFSSRHYPRITVWKGLSLTLEDEAEHSDDIRRYIRSKLRIDGLFDNEDLGEEILRMSSNIFLWVVLVVAILNKEHDKGGDVSVKRKLREVPTDLHRLFHDILTRDHEDLDQLILCIQWILFSKRPLGPEELYCAIQFGTDPDFDFEWDENLITRDRINRFNLNASKGLAEVTKRDPMVQFIHESVRDYLLEGDGLRILMESRTEMTGPVEGHSHNALKETCVAQIRKASKFANLSIFPDLTESPRLALGRMPLLRYAMTFVLSHAGSARRAGSDQSVFLQTFPTKLWVELGNIIWPEKHQEGRNGMPAFMALELEALKTTQRGRPWRKVRVCLENDPLEGLEMSLDPYRSSTPGTEDV
ncbi:hypothetical protein F4780DRAFT_446561 [Xylariomycetidae sp. FL0641]|nr:hypothetical protein F4780DRAFT_446561 [Xylariomycetidae sp. FL0641]